MQRSIVLAAVGAAAIGSAGLGLSSAAADSYPHVTANVDITSANKSPVRNDAIPTVAVDPADSNHVVVAEGDFRTGTCLLHVSTDGGATFGVAKRSFLPTEFEHCTPNAGNTAFPMAWAQDGSLLVAMHAFNGTATVFDGPVNVVVSRTSNFGDTWDSVVARRNGPNATGNGPSGARRTPHLQPSEAPPTPTPSPSSTPSTPPTQGVFGVHLASDRKGHVYVSYQARNLQIPGVSKTENRAVVVASSDDGRTFGAPVDIAGGTADSLATRRGPAIAVAPDGTLFAILKQDAPAKGSPATDTPSLVVYKSTDQGKTFTKSALQPNTNATDYCEIGVAPVSGGVGYVVVAVYEDLADGAAGQQQVRDIYMRRSTDGGGTWSARKRLSDDNPESFRNKFIPGISTAPNGRIDVAWQDFRNDNGNLLTDVYATSSSDGGASWTSNIRVSDHSANRHYGQFANYSDVRGAVGVASDNYAAYFAWDDSRNASADKPVQDVYYAAVQLAAVPASSGYTTARVVGSVIGGLLTAGVLLGVGSLVLRRRRSAGPPVVGAETR